MNPGQITPEQVQLANDFAKAFFPIWWSGVAFGVVLSPFFWWLFWDLSVFTFRLIIPHRLRMRWAYRFVRWAQSIRSKPYTAFKGWRFVTVYPDARKEVHRD